MTRRSATKPRNLILTSALWLTSFVFAVVGLCGAQAEQRNPSEATTFGYVVNRFDNTVSVIDTTNNKVVATIPVGGLPEAVAATPDGANVYVTNEDFNSVSVIDTTSNKVVDTIPVGGSPNGVAITPKGDQPYAHDDRYDHPFAYVANGADNTVSVIDSASNIVVATITVGLGPNGVAITSDGSHVYVTNQLDSTVSVVETAGNTVVATIPVGGFPTEVAITSDGTYSYQQGDRRHPPLAYVTNQLDDTVSVIDTANNAVVATIPVGGDPTGVAITPDGTHVYVANLASIEENTVSVIDTASNKVVATITVGFSPNGVAITPDGTHSSEHDGRRPKPVAYVTNTDDNTVSVIDTTNNEVVATIPVGNLPFAVTFATVPQ